MLEKLSLLNAVFKLKQRLWEGIYIKTKKYISEIITAEDIASWTPETIVLITAPTGLGKSHFIKHALNKYLEENGKDCLYLIPRDNVKKQFQEEIKSPLITFELYQKLDYHKRYQTDDSLDFLLKDNFFIVADEAHYFFDDARFNSTNDISLDWILQQNQSIKIFMTATGNILREYLKSNGYSVQELHLEDDFGHIDNLFFYNDYEQIGLIADEIIKKDKKGLFVFTSAEKAFVFWEKYKNNAMFMCSEHNKKFSKYMDEKLVSDMLNNQMFNCNMLVTTAVLDCGVNFKDKDLTTICLDLVECSSIVQAIGRKRFKSDDEKIDVFIKSVNNNQLGGLIRTYAMKLEQAKLLLDNSKEYEKKYGHGAPANSMIVDEAFEDSPSNIHNNRKRVRINEFYQAKSYIDDYNKMTVLGKCGFCKYISQLLGKGCFDYKVYDGKKPSQSLYQFLESMVDVPMYMHSDRRELIERLNISQNGRLCSGYCALSGWLQDSKMPFRLEKFTKYKLVDGKRRRYKATWVIVKHNDSISA